MTRPGEFGFLKFLEYLAQIKFLKPGTMILFDGERSFMTKKIQEFCVAHHFYAFVIKPAILHQLLNPCDNSFHSLFKLSYNQEISNRSSIDKITTKEKLQIARKCYEDVPKDAVISMFKKCGLFGGDYEAMIGNLVNEGLHYLRGDKKLSHQKQLRSYIKWCQFNKLEDSHLEKYHDFQSQIVNFLKL